MTLLSGVAACTTKKPSAPAAGARFDLSKMTCAEYAAVSESLRPRAIAWMEGYDRGRRVTDEAVGEVDVDRQTATVVVACQETPKVTLWDKIRAHFPGGSKKVKPTAMTCEEFTALSESEQAEVAYWADGYNRARRVNESAVGVVDLDRDVAVIVQVCKPAPKESVWGKIKSHF
jgi:hypothetical protein